MECGGTAAALASGRWFAVQVKVPMYIGIGTAVHRRPRKKGDRLTFLFEINGAANLGREPVETDKRPSDQLRCGKRKPDTFSGTLTATGLGGMICGRLWCGGWVI